MPMAEFFSSRAKALLEVEMDSPRVATVQALVVLSAHEAAFTRDARGWLYSGMAMRLAVDLGLHMNAETFVTTGVMSRTEADIRRTTYFGVYMLDMCVSVPSDTELLYADLSQILELLHGTSANDECGECDHPDASNRR